MRSSPILLIASLIFLLSISAITQGKDASLLEDLTLNKPKKVILDNGLTVVLKEVPSSGIVSFDVRVKAGSVYEGEFAGSGVSHFVEHMFFKGTAKRGPGEVEKEIRSRGGIINGATTFDYVTFTITMPKEEYSYALEVLSDSLFSADMDPREMEKERGVILKEIKLNRDDPARYISRLLWSSVFKSHPYRHPIIGYENLFLKLTREDLLKYYNKMYVPNNVVLTVVGDIEIESALKEVEIHFKNIERGALEEKSVAQERPQSSARTLEVEQELEMAYFALGYRSVDAYSVDMPALDILSAILGGGESSRLNSNVYRKKNLVYSVGSWNYTPRDPGVFIISGITEPKKLTAALGAIKEEIDNIKKNGVDEDEFERVKAVIIADYIYSLESPADQARDLAANEITMGDFDFTKEYLKKIDSVTRDDIERVAKFYLNDNALSSVTLSPPSKKPPLEKSLKGLEKNIQKTTLSNGLTVLLMEDHKLPVVSMIAASLGGLSVETKKTSGISNLTALMMLKGTESISEEEISELVEGMGADLDYFSGNNTFGIKFNLLSKDLDEGFELFKDIMLNSSFPEEILQREKETVMASIMAAEDDILSSGMKLFKETLFKEHPYRFQTIGTVDSVKDLTRGDLENFYKEYFAPGNMALAVFGDIEAQKLKEKVSSELSALEKRAPGKFAAVKEPVQTKIREELKAVPKEQSLVIMGFKGATIDSKDRYTLQLISAGLSGISGRLSARLREDCGIAYALGSFSVPALDPGYFALYILTTKDNIERAKLEFIDQIKLLNKKGLTPQELDSTKKELAGQHRIALQTNAALAHQAALDELYGLGYDNYLKYDDIITSITNNDIIDASRRYLKPDVYTVAIIEGKKSDAR